MKRRSYYTIEILKMFFPVFISRVGMFTMSIVDSIILAHYNSLHLGYQSIADTPIIFIMLAINGLTQGVLFMTSEAFGKKDYAACGSALKQSIRQALLLSIIAVPIALFAPILLSFFNYTEENIKISSTAMRVLAIGIPFVSLYMVSQFFLQGIKRPWVSTCFVFVANIINIVIDLILVNGMLWFPPMGAVGVSTATTFVRVFLGLGVIIYIFTCKEFQEYIKPKESSQKFVVNKTQRSLGFGATANILSTESAYAFCLFFISTISIAKVSAYTLSFRFLIINSLCAISLAVAASVFVSIGMGRKSKSIIKDSVFASLNINNMILVPVGILSFIFSRTIAGLLTNDPTLADETSGFLKIMAAVLVFNGTQNILQINLRAVHDLIIPSIIIFIFYTLMVPILCLLFADTATTVLLFILLANILTSGGLLFRFIYIMPHYKFKDD